MSQTLSDFVTALRRSALIPHEALEQITAATEAPDAQPKSIAKWIVQQGWLSTFQVKMIWNGRASELSLGQYTIIEKLGEGGMGEVFRARHRRMGREVALKVIRKERLENPEAVRRFQREIQAAAQLSHENVVMAYDADQQGEIHFFAMELVEGTNLSQKVKDEGPLPVEEACHYVRQAAMGLQHAHERGMVHRDVKPSNLFLSKQGQIKVLDLGLARLYDSDQQQTRITQEGLVIGTPDFIAPEQARDSRKADIRADIYALGCTFYYLLTSEPPYGGGTPTEKMLKHTTEPIPDVTQRRPDVPPALGQMLQKMLAKAPQERFQTPSEIAQMIQLILEMPATPLPARPVSFIPNPMPTVEPTTDSQFRIKPKDGRVELNPIYQPREGRHYLILAFLGICLLFC